MSFNGFCVMLSIAVLLVGAFGAIRILWPDQRAMAAIPLNIAALIAVALSFDAIRVPPSDKAPATVAPTPPQPDEKAAFNLPARAPVELAPAVSALPRHDGDPARKQTAGNRVLQLILNEQFLKAAAVFSQAEAEGMVDETIRKRVEIQALRQVSHLEAPMRMARAYALLVTVRPANKDYATAAETGVSVETAAPLSGVPPGGQADPNGVTEVKSGAGPCPRDVFLDLEGVCRKVFVLGLGKKRVEPAAMVHGAQGRCRDTEAEGSAERFGRQRNLVQVRVKLPPRLVVGVADIVAALRVFAGQFGNDVTFYWSSTLSPRSAIGPSRKTERPSYAPAPVASSAIGRFSCPLLSPYRFAEPV